LTGLVQGWYVANDAGSPDSFRLRRAEIGLEAVVAPKVAWRMMIDPAKGTSFLQDAHLTLGTSQWAVDVGRFKVPISREGLQSSSTLETIERARFTSDKANGGELGDVRDVGVKLRGATKWVDLQVALMNSLGQARDTGAAARVPLAVSGRLLVRVPELSGLELGMSAGWGFHRYQDRSRQSRLSGDVMFTRGRLRLRAEAMRASERQRATRLGYYALAAFRVRPELDLVARYDDWDPDTGRDLAPPAFAERDLVAGFTRSLPGPNTKIQINGVRRELRGSIDAVRYLLAVNVQVAWPATQITR
jgi:hypothetical protein